MEITSGELGPTRSEFKNVLNEMIYKKSIQCIYHTSRVITNTWWRDETCL